MSNVDWNYVHNSTYYVSTVCLHSKMGWGDARLGLAQWLRHLVVGVRRCFEDLTPHQ